MHLLSKLRVKLINQQPIGCNVAFAPVPEIAGQKIFTVLHRQRLAFNQILHDGLHAFCIGTAR